MITEFLVHTSVRRNKKAVQFPCQGPFSHSDVGKEWKVFYHLLFVTPSQYWLVKGKAEGENQAKMTRSGRRVNFQKKVKSAGVSLH